MTPKGDPNTTDAPKGFPATFWVANLMEIFERMAWYGFYAVSSLYITGSVEEGGLGLTSEQRGIIQGIIPFLLYLFPIVTGALGDKFGFKRTFFIAYLIMTPSYWLMGQPDGFWGFFFVFLLVAIGAATFKPVVVGTVGHTTTDKNKAMGFGIFYMMVNIGGFAGPIVAGIVRNKMGWPWVFNMSAIWIACNFIWLFLFYREPEGRSSALNEELEEAKQRLAETRQLDRLKRTGPPQLAAASLRLLPTFLVAGFLFGWLPTAIAVGFLIVLAVSLRILVAVVPADVRLLLRKTGEDVVEVLGNGGFFIMVMGSIFILMLAGGNWISWTECMILAAVLILGNLILDFGFLRARRDPQGLWQTSRIGDWRFVLYLLILSGFWTEFNQLFLTMPEYIRDYTNTHDILGWLAGLCGSVGLNVWADGLRNAMSSGYQINPEWLVNVDAGAIVVFQVLISAVFAKWKPFTTMIVGTIITGIGLALGVYGEIGWIVVLAIFIFAIGEMMASPKSQEYVARIAPKAKTAMYMGYYFVAIALGNLFAGILSGQMYGHYGRDVRDPDTMWLIFGAIGIVTAGILWLYDRVVVRRAPRETE
ncbi:MAG: MFS transporter [Candidatus Latescibacterota bacterium]|nr:MAG: MFS transporter [Candidatus Latescibacterota bacterium]